MGPPRERDGELKRATNESALTSLQWGRRVNATESLHRAAVGNFHEPLQWGRRVNATERRRMVKLVWSTTPLQWGRRVNATERCYQLGIPETQDIASMGPPRERDGEQLVRLGYACPST